MSEPSRQEKRTSIADSLIYVNKPITFTDTKEIFIWNDEEKIYCPGETSLETQIQDLCGDETNNTDISEIINIIRRKTYTSREEIEQKNLNLIPLQNGLFDLETETIIDYSPEHFVFFKHPIFYNAIAQCYSIDVFLNQITENNLEKKEILLKLIGYCFYRTQKYQRAFMLVGKGSNGKTVFLNILTALLGKQQITNMQLQDIIENRFFPGRLYRKSANIFDDLQQKALRNTGVFKALTGEGQLDCDRKFKDSFKFDCITKMIFACNRLPKTSDDTDAFYRRWVIIQFTKQFLNEEKDASLTEKLCIPEELSGLFNMSMAALKETINQRGFPDQIEENREMYEKNSDISKAFCYDCLELNLDTYTKKDDLWQKYLEYCKKNDTAADSEKAFYRTIYNFFDGKVYSTRKLLELESERIWIIQGLKLKENP